MSNIKQHTPEWHNAKSTLIGGSSIYSLVSYYCSKECREIGIDLSNEPPFKSCLEEFLRIKFELEQEPIPLVHQEFGLGMESYITNRLNNEFKETKSYIGTDEFITNKELHPLASCSPDGYIEIKDAHKLPDFDQRTQIDNSWGKGISEYKTVPYGFNFDSKEGTKWQYIFQLNYNMLVTGLKWGELNCLCPKERDFDIDFHKGKVIGKIELINQISKDVDLSKLNLFEDIYSQYNLYSYTYAANKTIQNLCLLALKRFQQALDNEQMVFPEISKGDKVKLLREKKLLAQIAPKRFGELEANDFLTDLLQQRVTTAIEKKKVETELEELNCEIIKNMQDHVSLVSDIAIAKFTKSGSLRVNPIN